MSRGTRILVVDDEPAIHRFLKPSLVAEGYDVVQAMTGEAAVDGVAAEKPDIVLLDLGLPDLDGKEVIRRVRAFSEVPIVVLSAREREAEKIEALDLGADDFINKPFGVGELMARLRAAQRHAMRRQGEQPVLKAGEIEVDVPARRVLRGGDDVKLTPKEFELFAFLVRHAGRVLTHGQILNAVWGPAHAHDTQYLRVYVKALRQKLEADPSAPALILTESGVGYRIAEASASARTGAET
ncbi:response regulator [Salinarimonas sp. NSM]|uniref:response regulator n=1 Tax=Salinarimonas sp. NSM TaxID=3458003 RepID=UPI0040366B99